jgi:hypothetical protein
MGCSWGSVGGKPQASQRRLGETPWPRMPQKLTSIPNARAAATIERDIIEALDSREQA